MPGDAFPDAEDFGPDFLDELEKEETARDPTASVKLDAAVRRREFLRSLAGAREDLGLSQTEVAARMGTSQSAVARLERGEVDPHMSTVERYLAAVGRTLRWTTTPREKGAVVDVLPSLGLMGAEPEQYEVALEEALGALRRHHDYAAEARATKVFFDVLATHTHFLMDEAGSSEPRWIVLHDEVDRLRGWVDKLVADSTD